MKVEEFMTSNLETCRPGMSLTDAAMRMWHRDCGVLPVTDEGNRVVGMITDRDICIGLAIRHRSPDEVSVADVMSTDIYSCTSDEEIHHAMETMAQGKIRRLPVVNEKGELCGILSQNDIIQHAEKNKSGNHTKKQRVTYEDAMHTLKAISASWLPVTVDD